MATYCISGSVLRKAGDNFPTAVEADAIIDEFIDQAEGTANTVMRKNFIDNYDSLNADVKKILEEVTSNIAAIYVLNYKPTGEDGTMNRLEYEDKVNILRDAALRGLSILRDEKTQTFMKNA